MGSGPAVSDWETGQGSCCGEGQPLCRDTTGEHGGQPTRRPIDTWLATWSEPDAAARGRLLDGAVVDGILLRDRFSLVEGRADLDPHLAAVHQFMPGMTLTRRGAMRHCQGTVLADWVASGPDGAEQGRGTNVFGLAPSGMIASVIGFWETDRV